MTSHRRSWGMDFHTSAFKSRYAQDAKRSPSSSSSWTLLFIPQAKILLHSYIRPRSSSIRILGQDPPFLSQAKVLLQPFHWPKPSSIHFPGQNPHPFIPKAKILLTFLNDTLKCHQRNKNGHNTSHIGTKTRGSVAVSAAFCTTRVLCLFLFSARLNDREIDGGNPLDWETNDRDLVMSTVNSILEKWPGRNYLLFRVGLEIIKSSPILECHCACVLQLQRTVLTGFGIECLWQ